MTSQDIKISNKILVSMIAYRERYLAESVKDCYEKADNPNNLYFSIVSEQSKDHLHADLSFIPVSQIMYRKYDLSTYRGVLWSRAKTTQIDVDYDYVLYTCGHNLFVQGWDSLVLEEYQKTTAIYEKTLITVSGPEFERDRRGRTSMTSRNGRTSNYHRPKISKDYVPGYGFPEAVPLPQGTPMSEDVYLQFSWVFAPKLFVDEVPLDSDINYHAEEIYTTIKAWSAGWRFFSTEKIMYYHDTYKEYPGEQLPRSTTHRPWSDINKEAFWQQSDESMKKLNLLLSGNMPGIPLEKIIKYCNYSGLDSSWCNYNPKYHKLKYQRHGEFFRYKEPFRLD